MMNRPRLIARHSRRRLFTHASLIAVATLLLGLSPVPTHGQSQTSTEDLGGCTLKDQVYHCDGAAFQKALSAAGSAAIETHNADGVARDRLTAFVSTKLGKTIVAPGAPADLAFLMIPVDDQGVLNDSVGDASLGTLRIYTVRPDGSRGHLLWAETFNGQRDMPWPAVVRGLILQFQSRFHIK
ncbi:MAG: hypothetical protein ABSG84_03205 [Acidobacteriaceae bacterium]|jgi:hypothetical protein